ncbi:DUF3592 domain-containing protein [Actinomadura barringtoniae]|uniref:DUF3592 domain-containing protein n=1 Tax=Actinomadura barringtoniae TaxID=1427535 RepID=A0A939T4I1_9ACTN|nr:DUF3592 domain-containing protein [Actinomadura barringtoniae]MBO2445942.1 DUF3592 domain-containing protein [Actinomadura barringtoniae]
MLALFPAGIASWLIFDEVQREEKGVEAPAVVVKRWSGSKDDFADVVFTTATGRQVKATIRDDEWAEMPKVGAHVRVRYVPSWPEDSAVDAHRPLTSKLMGPVLLLSLALMCALGPILTRRRKKAIDARKQFEA